jgi:hypothetical protein
MTYHLPDYAWESYEDMQWREHEALLDAYAWEPIDEGREP